jgi:hypothetical protein
MSEEQTADTQNGGNRNSVRSIAYPFITLDAAIARAVQFWEKDRKTAVPSAVAIKHWKFSEKSSGGRQTIAALIQFGLMLDEGFGDKRLVRLTERGIDLAILPPDDPQRLVHIQAAARSPKIYAELLSKWAELPSDSTIRYFMLKEKNFNQNAVDGFIEDFRSTIRYAKISQSDTMPSEQEAASPLGTDVQPPTSSAEVKFMNEAQPKTPVMQPQAQAPTDRKRGTKQDGFWVDEGQVVLQWPDGMSKESYEDFKDWIDLQLRKIGRAVQ